MDIFNLRKIVYVKNEPLQALYSIGLLGSIGMAYSTDGASLLVTPFLMGIMANNTFTERQLKKRLEDKLNENGNYAENFNDAKQSIEHINSTVKKMKQEEIDYLKNIKSYKAQDTFFGFPSGIPKYKVEINQNE